MKRKILSLTLAFVLVFMVLPVPVQAEDTINITGHTAGNLEDEITVYMSVYGISVDDIITELSVSGGTLNNVDRVFLYDSDINKTVKTVDFSGTSIDYSGTIQGGYFSADNPNEIPPYAFGNWYDLTSIVLPDSVTVIEDWAFNMCTSLETVYLPSGLTTIVLK